MVKRVTKTISFSPETQEKLNRLTEKTGMKESEIIRELIYKAVEDDVELTILIQKFLNRESQNLGKERLLRIMSIRKSLKKNAGTQRPAPAVSIDDQEQYTPIQQKEIDRIHEYMETIKKEWNLCEDF